MKSHNLIDMTPNQIYKFFLKKCGGNKKGALVLKNLRLDINSALHGVFNEPSVPAKSRHIMHSAHLIEVDYAKNYYEDMKKGILEKGDPDGTAQEKLDMIQELLDSIDIYYLLQETKENILKIVLNDHKSKISKKMARELNQKVLKCLDSFKGITNNITRDSIAWMKDYLSDFIDHYSKN
jgi:hypothetical protein